MNKEIEEAIEHLELFKEDLKELEVNEDFILQDGMKIDTLQSLQTILNYTKELEEIKEKAEHIEREWGRDNDWLQTQAKMDILDKILKGGEK